MATQVAPILKVPKPPWTWCLYIVYVLQREKDLVKEVHAEELRRLDADVTSGSDAYIIAPLSSINYHHRIAESSVLRMSWWKYATLGNVMACRCQFKRVVRIFVIALVAAVLFSTYLLDSGPATPTDDVTRSRDRSIDAVERHCFRFDMGGRMFDEGGLGAQVSNGSNGFTSEKN